jgi:hypothetical protein
MVDQRPVEVEDHQTHRAGGSHQGIIAERAAGIGRR